MPLILLVAGCLWITDEQQASRLDADGDGVLDAAVGGPDCDDADPTWGLPTEGHADDDGDGWGADEAVARCEWPDGFLETGGDCDDGDPEANPDALEVCHTGRDLDCDGLVAECSLTDAGILLLGDVEGAHAGTSAAGIGDVNGDGLDDVAVGSPDGPDGGKISIVTGRARVGEEGDGQQVWLSDARATYTGVAGDRLGEAMVAGDLDGDGDLELVVGAPGGDFEARGATGLAHLLEAPWPVGEASASAHFLGEAVGDQVGATLALGDADDDLYRDDLLVGAPGADDGGGLAYLMYGPFEGDVDLWEATQRRGAKFVPPAASGWGLATSVAMADLDEDARDDVLLGTPGLDTSRADVGGVFLCTGNPTGVVYLDDCGLAVEGAVDRDAAGSALAAADLDDDGYVDVLVGAPGADGDQVDVGAVYLLRGSASAWWTPRSLEDADATWRGESDESEDGGGRAGTAVAVPGDIDGDGALDVVIGAPRYGERSLGANTGGAWFLLGPLPLGAHTLAEADDRYLCDLSNEDAALACTGGTALAAAGDFDGDTVLDVLVGGVGMGDGTIQGGGVGVVFGSRIR